MFKCRHSVDRFKFLKCSDVVSAAISTRLTASHPNSEVKLVRAGVVLRWGTTREGPVLRFFFRFAEGGFFSFSATSRAFRRCRRQPARGHEEPGRIGKEEGCLDSACATVDDWPYKAGILQLMVPAYCPKGRRAPYRPLYLLIATWKQTTGSTASSSDCILA